MRRPSDMQIYYQRNMLCGNLIIIVLTIFISIYFSFQTTPKMPVSTLNHTVSNQSQEISVNQSEPVQKLISHNAFNPYASKHNGFIGFLNLQAVNYLPVEIKVNRPTQLLDAEFEIHDDLIMSYSLYEGDDTGIYLGGESDYMFTSYAETKSFNREIEVLRHIDPEYPWVANESNKEGEVTALVYIDSIGNMTMFPDWVAGDKIRTFEYAIHGESQKAQYAINEEPEGWFFANNFTKVLSQWRFSPRIKNNKPVGSLLRIRYTYCLGISCVHHYLLEHVASSNLRNNKNTILH